MSTTTDIRLDILYKKFALGVPDANPNKDAAAEAGLNRPSVIPSLQILTNTIPATAPTDLSAANFTPANSGGTKQVSTTYSYIAKYTQLKLKDATSSKLGVSFAYSTTQASNLCTYAIPFNYDLVTATYAITVYDSLGTVIASNDATNPWVFDPDAGVLTFTSTVTNYKLTNAPPSITFWRYEGQLGFSIPPSGVDLSANQIVNGVKTFGNIITASGGILSLSDSTFNKSVYVLGDVSINGNILLGGDISINGNIHFPVGSINAAAISGGGAGVYLGGSEKVTFDDDMFAVIKEGKVKGAVSTDSIFYGTINVAGDVSFNGNVYANKNIFLVGDLSAAGNLYAVTQPSTDNSKKVATTAYVQSQGYTTQQTLFRQFA